VGRRWTCRCKEQVPLKAMRALNGIILYSAYSHCINKSILDSQIKNNGFEQLRGSQDLLHDRGNDEPDEPLRPATLGQDLTSE